MRNDHHVVFTVSEVRRAPVDLNDYAFDTALQKDRIADIIRFFNAQRQSGENISQSVLESKTQHDRDHAGGGDDSLEGQCKNGTQYGKRRANIDASGDNIGHNLVLYRRLSQGGRKCKNGDKLPCSQDPPDASQDLKPELTRQIFRSESRTQWRTD